MAASTIDAVLLKKMFLTGAQNLEAKKEWINELNVFPVPDGDTGTNMSMTIMSAVKEVSGAEETMEGIAKGMSSGSLRGARGNSGVILSQLIRGFTRGIKGHPEITVETLPEAMKKAVDTAYKAVMKPKEGTILTVAKGIAVKAEELAGEALSMEAFLGAVIEEGRVVLDQTPEMLPVLKEAGVVDSGGQGLITVLEGAYDAFLGKEIDLDFKPETSSGYVKISKETEEEIKFGYCTEFIIMLNKPMSVEDEVSFKEYLVSLGDSIVLVADDEIVKVHVHTNDPGLAIQKALTFGALTRMKIDNMREEHEERLIKDATKLANEQAAADAAKAKAEEKEVGFIAVSVGEGFDEIFKGLNVDHVVSGGQTMNPSTDDILKAIEKVNARNIFIYPNNKNIILAANQARDLTEDKNILVVGSKTVPQGITALINYSEEMSPEENLDVMTEAIGNVKTGQITYAVRDTKINDKEIHEGDYMAVGDDGILSVGKDLMEVAKETLDAMVFEDAELISIYYGADFTEAQAEEIAAYASEKFHFCDVEVNFGGQPVYYCIVSVE